MLDSLDAVLAPVQRRKLELAPEEVTCSDQRTPEEVHANAMARGARCTECPLYGLRLGPIKSHINQGPLAVLSDDPKALDLKTGTPLSDNGGQFMFEQLAAVNVGQGQVSVLQTIECRRPEALKAFQASRVAEWQAEKQAINAQRKDLRAAARKAATPAERYALEAAARNLRDAGAKPLTPEEACFPRLEHDIKTAQAAGANTFLLFGNTALSSFGRVFNIPHGGKVKVRPEDVKITSLKRMLGCVVEAPGKAPTFIPSYAPGFGLVKGQFQYKHPIGEYIKRAGRVARRGGRISWKRAKRKYIDPTVETVEAVINEMVDRAYATGEPIYCDIETDGLNNRRSHLHCVGLGQFDEQGEQVVIIVPWRESKGNTLWWSLKAPTSTDAHVALGELRHVQTPANATTEPQPLFGDHAAQMAESSRDPTRRGWRWDTKPSVIAEAGSPATRVWHALKYVLDDPEISLVGHNFNAFDAYKLLLAGLMTDWSRAHDCTMLGSRNTYACDLPMGLGFATSMRMEVGPFKDAANDKYVLAVSDEVLQSYCADDVAETGKLHRIVQAERRECHTTGQHRTDVTAAPHYRNMGDLGFCVDQVEHGRLWARMRERRNHYFNALAHDVWAITKGSTELKDLRQIEEWFPGHGGWALPHEADLRFNPDSGDLIREILYKRKHIAPIVGRAKVNGRMAERDFEEGDDPSTSATALTRIRVEKADALEKDPEAKRFIEHLLEYRAYAKIVSTYIEGPIKPRKDKGHRKCPWCGHEGIAWMGVCGACGVFLDDTAICEEDGGWWLHPQFRQSIPTGRVACSPTIQNWPERGKCNMRRIVVAPEGYLMVGADLDQVELRLYAIIAGDEEMLKVIRDGLDAHSYNYATIKASNPLDKAEVMALYHWVEALEKKGKDGKQQRKHCRNIAKRFVYLIVYGGEEDKLFATMATDRDKSTGKLMFPDLSEDDTKIWFANWHRIHPWTLEWQKACKHAAKTVGYVTSPLLDYRRRFFLGGPNKINAAPNSVIQPSAAAIANMGVINAAQWWRHREWGRYSGLNSQVHDYIGGYVPIARAEEACRRLEKSMYFQYNGMAFTCKAKASRSWGDQ